MRVSILVAAAAISAASAAEAVTSPPKSRLTSLSLSSCTRLSRHRDGGAWRCAGLPGFPVYVAEGDLRTMLAFGPSPEKRRSASQTLPPFNSIFEGRQRATVEWRIVRDNSGRDVPFATIVRYHTRSDDGSGEVLVVTKVDARDSCQLAKIDASANESAIVIAREWADANARAAPCPETPEVLGKRGRSPM